MIGALLITMAIILGIGILPLSIYLIRSMWQQEPDVSEPLDEGLAKGPPANEAFEWWEARRGQLNRGLAVAGGVSGAVYYGYLYAQSEQSDNSYFVFNWFSLFFQVAAFLVYMGIANLVYNLGLILEQVRHTHSLHDSRQKVFNWLYGLELAAPLIFVVYLIIKAHA